VLLVVTVHLVNPDGFGERYLGGDAGTGWLYLPGQCGVDLFFVISGLIMTLTTWKLARGAAEARAFLARRVKRIYPVYWIVTLPVFVVFLVDSGLVNSHQVHPPQPLQSFLILPQAGFPLVLVGWTLVYEMYFYAIFAAALLGPRRLLPWIIAFWSIVTIALAVTVQHSDLATVRVLANPIVLEFALGVAVGFAVMKAPLVAPAAALIAGIVVLAGVLAGAGAWGEQELSGWLRAVGVGPACALIVYGAIGLEERHAVSASRTWQTLGDASYSIYLWHVLILAMIGRVVAHFTPVGVLHLPILLAAGVITVAIATALYFAIERPLLRVLGTRSHLAAQPDRA
jgi:peptidoglycan/LPS O-acetylase OafA/YrhL